MHYINIILKELIGIEFDISITGKYSRKDKTYIPSKTEIFGKVYVCYGVHETQVRETLHFHIIIWCVLSTELLQYRAKINNYLNKFWEH